jgi:hypothetical protein
MADEMSRAFSTQGREMHTKFWYVNMKESEEDLDIEGRTITK